MGLVPLLCIQVLFLTWYKVKLGLGFFSICPRVFFPTHVVLACSSHPPDLSLLHSPPLLLVPRLWSGNRRIRHSSPRCRAWDSSPACATPTATTRPTLHPPDLLPARRCRPLVAAAPSPVACSSSPPAPAACSPPLAARRRRRPPIPNNPYIVSSEKATKSYNLKYYISLHLGVILLKETMKSYNLKHYFTLHPWPYPSQVNFKSYTMKYFPSASWS